jgi:hypothetical protein
LTVKDAWQENEVRLEKLSRRPPVGEPKKQACIQIKRGRVIRRGNGCLDRVAN